MIKRKKQQKELTQHTIEKYTLGKNASILFALVSAPIFLIIGLIVLMIDGIAGKTSMWGMILVAIFIVMMVMAIFLISHYDKERQKLIQKVSTSSFKMFFKYFSDADTKKAVYFEMKDIFMYGLWHIVDTNPFLRVFAETDALELNKDFIKNKISKKEFLALSMFKCLTFRKEGIVYRNQYIYLNQESFLELTNAYAKIYFDEENHTEEYLTKCEEIEKQYNSAKLYAIEHYEGLANNIGMKERFINFSNNARSVIYLKQIMVICAIIGFFIQPINSMTNEMVTKLFNGITIILLLVDVAKKSDKDIIH